MGPEKWCWTAPGWLAACQRVWRGGLNPRGSPGRRVSRSTLSRFGRLQAQVSQAPRRRNQNHRLKNVKRIARHTVLVFLPPLLSMMLLVGCSPAPAPEQQPNGARNVILFIGDGFGATQVSLAIQYARLVEHRELDIDAILQDGNTGYSLTIPFGNIVTDSAAAATQIATGQLARNDMLGLDPDGYPLETILEWADKRGLGTGLVTNMRITSTGEHTSDPVPTYGRGPGAEKLRGIYSNTHVYSVMRESLEAGIDQ